MSKKNKKSAAYGVNPALLGRSKPVRAPSLVQEAFRRLPSKEVKKAKAEFALFARVFGDLVDDLLKAAGVHPSLTNPGPKK